MEPYAIFLDIDGTLTSSDKIPKENIDTINRLRKQGHFVFYNTGRSYGFIPEFCKTSLELDGFVAGIGSHVVCGNTELKKERLTDEEVLSVARRFLPTGRFVIFEGENTSVAFGPDSGDVNTLMIKSIDEIYTHRDIPLTKGFISGVLSVSEQEYFKERYNFFQHENYAEFAHKGCSKSEGMRLILRHLGISREKCIAIGDSVNDIYMLNFAGISVAMGNASDKIKQLCDTVTCSNDEAGVAKALLRIIGT